MIDKKVDNPPEARAALMASNATVADVSSLRGDTAALLHLFFPQVYDCSSWMPRFLGRRLRRAICARRDGNTPSPFALAEGTRAVRAGWTRATALQASNRTALREILGSGLQTSLRRLALDHDKDTHIQVLVVALKRTPLGYTHMTLFLRVSHLREYTAMRALVAGDLLCSLGAKVQRSWGTTQLHISTPDVLLETFEPQHATVVDSFSLTTMDAERMLRVLDIFAPSPRASSSSSSLWGGGALDADAADPSESLLELLFPGRFSKHRTLLFRRPFYKLAKDADNNRLERAQQLVDDYFRWKGPEAPGCNLRQWVDMQARMPGLLQLSVIAVRYSHFNLIGKSHVSLFFSLRGQNDLKEACSVGAELTEKPAVIPGGPPSRSLLVHSPDRKLKGASSWLLRRLVQGKYRVENARVFAAFDVDHRDTDSLLALLPERSPTTDGGGTELHLRARSLSLLEEGGGGDVSLFENREAPPVTTSDDEESSLEQKEEEETTTLSQTHHQHGHHQRPSRHAMVRMLTSDPDDFESEVNYHDAVDSPSTRLQREKAVGRAAKEANRKKRVSFDI